MPLPEVGNEFEVNKILCSLVGGLISIGYDKRKN
jgi:hypothetical protein